MHAHVFQHVPFEGPGAIERLLVRRGLTLSRTAFFAGETPPPAGGVDFLIVMGGPMSVHDTAAHPWLADEIAFLREYLATGRPVLGVCLGAQLIAYALGAEVKPNPEPEIGWFPVRRVNDGFGFPPEFTVFHWHGETFDLPPGATPLARSAACENQAFLLGGNVAGFQFHIESTPETCRALLEHCAADLTGAPFVQSVEEILAADEATFAAMHRILDSSLTQLLGV